jgi:competence protein ComEC
MLAGSVVAAAAAAAIWPVAAVAVSAGVCMVCVRRRAAGVLLAFCSGLALTGATLGEARRSAWPAALDGTPVIAVMRVVAAPTRRASGQRFLARLQVEAPARFAGLELDARVSVAAGGRAARVGDRRRTVVALYAPDPVVARRDGIEVIARVRPSVIDAQLESDAAGLAGLRARLAEQIAESTLERDAAALFAALAVGLTGGVSDEQWRVFAATGTTHLVAISGLHVTLLAAAAVLVTRRIWRRFACLQRVERDALAAPVGALVACGYALLAGMSVPTQRTLVMFAVWWLARTRGRAQHPLDVIGLALLAVLIVDPVAPLSAGFWLSFVAVAVLIASGGRARGAAGQVREAVIVQGRVALAVLPLTLGWFGRGALLGSVANFAAIPIFSFVLVPLVLAAVLLLLAGSSLAELPLQLALRVHDVAWPWLVAAADWPLAAIDLQATLLRLLLLTSAAASMLVSLPWSVRALGLCAGALALLPSAAPLNSGAAFQAEVLDAGEGLAVLVTTRSRTVLVGAAEAYGGRGERAVRLVGDALRRIGRSRIDLIVLPRASSFELAGARALAARWDVGTLVAGDGGEGGCAARTKRWLDGVLVEVAPDVAQGSDHTRSSPVTCTVRFVAPAGSLLVLGRARVDSFEPAARGANAVVLQGLSAVSPEAVRRAREEAPEVLIAPGRALASRGSALAARWGVDPARVLAPDRCHVVVAEAGSSGFAVERRVTGDCATR